MLGPGKTARVRGGFGARAYQLEARQAVLDSFAAHPEAGALLVMATGTGKTATAHFIAECWLKAGRRVVWLAHRQELLRQPLKTLQRWWPEYTGGIVQAGRNELGAQILYVSKDTVGRSQRRLDELLADLGGYPDLLIVDEAHHSPSPVYAKVISALRGPNTRMLGLTATPDREDNLRLSSHWQIVFNYGILDALEAGALLQPWSVVDQLPDMDLGEVGGRKDYNDADLAAALLKQHIVEHTVASMAKTHLAETLPFRDQKSYQQVRGRRILLFTATVEQARLTAEALCLDGWKARVISADTPSTERERLIAAFESGLVDVLCNAVLLTEGTDIPVADVVYICRPTKSWSLFVQMVGRALRPHGDQSGALIVDLVGATKMHSIVSAPVLVDGTDCVSADGKHRYLPVEGSGEGLCQDCGKKVPCFARLGAHRFKDGVCTGCGASQCREAPDGCHLYEPWENHTRRCVHCGFQVRDILAAMTGGKGAAKEPLAIERLAVPGEVWGTNLGDVGVALNVRAGDSWVPLWLTGSKVLRLSSRPVSPEMSRALLEDVARKAEKVRGQYGGATTDKMYKRKVMDARKMAIDNQVWKLGGVK